MLKFIAAIKVSPIPVNQSESKSGYDFPKIVPNHEAYSARLALTHKRRRPVLKNTVTNTPFVINLVCSDSVSFPMKIISMIMTILKP